MSMTSDENMTAPADATSRMPYGFGGGSVQFPGGQHATIPQAEVITNGVSWTCDGPVIDQKSARAMSYEQDV
jgi:hypothetical protein